MGMINESITFVSGFDQRYSGAPSSPSTQVPAESWHLDGS